MRSIRWFLIGALLASLFVMRPIAQDPSSIIRLTSDGWLVGAGNAVPLLLGSNGKGFIKISETGVITFINSPSPTFAAADGTVGAPSFTFLSDTTKGFYSPAANQIGVAIGGAVLYAFRDATNGFFLASGVRLSFNDDLALFREGASHLFQRLNTTAQRLSIANTYTGTTNYESFSIDWVTAPNVALIGSRTAATGTVRRLRLVTQESSGADAGLILEMNRDISAAGLFRFTYGTLTTGVAANYGNATPLVVVEPLNVATSGSPVVFRVSPTYNQSASSAANTDILINRTETSVGSGAQRFIDAQVAGSSRFYVTASGATGRAVQMATINQTAPTCSASCGTSPSVVGSDTAMIVTMGASGVPASPFTVTFNGTWAAAPSCTVMSALNTMVVGKMAIAAPTTTTTVIVTTNGTAPGTSDKYFIHCIGIQ